MKEFGKTNLGNYQYLEGSLGSKILKDICNKELQKGVPFTVFDLETTGLDPYTSKIVLFAFTFDGKFAYVFNPELIDESSFINLLSKSSIANHNVKFDYKFIKVKYGINLHLVDDTYLSYSLCTAGVAGNNEKLKRVFSARLDVVSERYLDILLDKSIRLDFIKPDYVIEDKHIEYAASDALCTFNLMPVFDSILKECHIQNIHQEIEIPFTEVLTDVELTGILLDKPNCIKLREEYREKIEECELKLKEFGDINWNSSKQKLELMQELGVDVPLKARKGKDPSPSLDRESLAKIDHPAANTLKEYSELTKIYNTFLVPWSHTSVELEGGSINPFTGRIHGDIRQTDTATGRCSMVKPNLMQVPPKLRELFIAPEGYDMVTVDLSSYELRVVADRSSDKRMCNIFNERYEKTQILEKYLENIEEVTYTEQIGTNYPVIKKLYDEINSKYDIHSQTAFMMFNLDPEKIDFTSMDWKEIRKKGKTFNFAILYGEGVMKIAATLGISVQEASKFKRTYEKTFPEVAVYIKETSYDAIIPVEFQLPEMIKVSNKISLSQTTSGRKRFYLLPEVSDPNFDAIQASIKRAAVNMTIQSLNADTMKVAMIDLHNRYKSDPFRDCKILLTVHDELVCECPKHITKQNALLQRQCMIDASNKFLKNVQTEATISIGSCWQK